MPTPLSRSCTNRRALVIDYPSIETGPDWVRHPAHGTVIAIKVRAKRSLLIFAESNENGVQLKEFTLGG
jgi:hypothetical protein